MLEPKKIIKVAAIVATMPFVLFYLYHQVIGTKNTRLETRPCISVSLDNTVSSTGYILRDEVLITSDGGGAVFAVVNDGDKIAAGQLVASIYENPSDAGTMARLDEIQKKLDILESSTIDQEYFTADISRLEADKNEVLRSLMQYKAKNKLSSGISLKKPLLISMNKLSGVKNGTSFERQIQELQNEKGLLSSKSGQAHTRIYAQCSGYYYGVTDGYEGIFTPSVLDSLSIDGFNSLINSSPVDKNNRIAGKIVKHSRWYLLCSLPKSSSATFEKGKFYDVSFPYSTNDTLSMKLFNKLSETDKEQEVLIFTTNTVPDEFDFSRVQKIQILSEMYRGLRVPKAAVRILDDGTKGVYVLIGSTVRFKTIEELYSLDDFYIVRDFSTVKDSDNEQSSSSSFPHLELNDMIIVSGKQLSDGKRID